MKKILFPLLILLTLSFFCTACGGRETGSTPADQSSGIEAGTAGLANPVVPSSETEIREKLGYTFGQVTDAQNVNYNIISGTLAEMNFTWNGAECTARIATAKQDEDISGEYYTWSISEPITLSGHQGTARRYRGEDKTVDSVIWYDETAKVAYSVSAEAPDLDGFDPLAIVQQVYLPIK